MITARDNALIKKAIEALKTITAKGYLSEKEREALEEIANPFRPKAKEWLCTVKSRFLLIQHVEPEPHSRVMLEQAESRSISRQS